MIGIRPGAALRRAALAGVLAASGLAAVSSAQVTRHLHDGSHDFDWEVGLWKTHLEVLRRNANGSTTWVTYEGTSKVVPLWNCRADMVELDATGPGGRHIRAINLRLYDPRSHQWSLNFANVTGGTMGVPTVGEFRRGVGRFYDQEPIGGREVLVRNVWSRITRNSAYFVQSISDDGGLTWHSNWMAHDTRVPGTADECEKGGNGASKARPAARRPPAADQSIDGAVSHSVARGARALRMH